MQRLLVLYFLGLFIFAVLIFVVDQAEREQQSAITTDEIRTPSDRRTSTGESRDRADSSIATGESQARSDWSSSTGEAEAQTDSSAATGESRDWPLGVDEPCASSNRSEAVDEPCTSPGRMTPHEPGVPSEQATVHEPGALPDSGTEAAEQHSPSGRHREANNPAPSGDGGERTVLGQERRSFEQPYLVLGYQSVPDAVRDCEMRYMQKIYLPFYTPPVGFTHQLAICSTHYTNRDYLEINYLHETQPDHRFMILMRPSKYAIEVPESRIVRTYALNDGAEALLSLTPEEGYHVLTFDRWGWQYMLVVPKKLESIFPPDEMVKVANSVQNGYPRRVTWRY